MIVVIMILATLMVLLINNNCDTDFEFHFTNCYFLKSSYITRVFLYNFFI